jgi:hypothetical protein
MQEYTDEFRKMALMLGIPLNTQETLMKYIGGLPAHICNNVFMFGPTNLDEVYVQATYIEAGKTGVGVSGESSSRKEDKRKWNERNQIQWQERKRSSLANIARNRSMMMTIVGNCIPRRDRSGSKRGKGGKQLQQQHRPTDLGSDSGDESKITSVGLTGKIGDGYDSRSKFFHIRVIMKHTKVDTLIDNRSQSNLISEEEVKQLGLNT